MQQRPFNFFLPLDIQKAGKRDGRNVYTVKGVASTPDRDADDEVLDPAGFDTSYLLKSGFFNWNHQASRDPSAYIGQPTKAYVQDRQFHIEGYLYGDHPLVQKLVSQQEIMQKAGSDRKLGFSIEGSAAQRDPEDPRTVTKTMVTGCALTFTPKNSNTWAAILKGHLTHEGLADEPLTLTRGQLYQLAHARYGLGLDATRAIVDYVTTNAMSKAQKNADQFSEDQVLKALGDLDAQLTKAKAPIDDDADDDADDDDEPVQKGIDARFAQVGTVLGAVYQQQTGLQKSLNRLMDVCKGLATSNTELKTQNEALATQVEKLMADLDSSAGQRSVVTKGHVPHQLGDAAAGDGKVLSVRRDKAQIESLLEKGFGGDWSKVGAGDPTANKLAKGIADLDHNRVAPETAAFLKQQGFVVTD